MQKLISLFLLGSISLLFISCEDQEEIKHLNSFPHWNTSLLNPSEVYLFFAKDLGDAAFPEEEHRPQQSPKQMPPVLKVGGLPTIGSYLKVAREQFAEQSIIIVGGAILKKSNSLKKNNLLLESLAQMPIDATLMSHQELIIAKSIAVGNSRLNWLNSNVLNIKTGNPISVWNSVSYKTLQRGKAKVGVVGVAELDNINEEQREDLKGHYFQGASTSILKLKQKLKESETDFNVLIYNGKNPCRRKLRYKILTFNALKNDSECLKGSPLEQLIKQLPPNLIHLVVATKGDFTTASIAGVPVLGNPDGTLYLSGVRIAFDELGKFDKKRSFFLAPLKYCQKMFAGLEDCQYSHSNPDYQNTRLKRLNKTAFGLIQARFLGREVRQNDLIKAIITGTVEIQSQDK